MPFGIRGARKFAKGDAIGHQRLQRRRDSSLTRGKIVVGVTIAMSGRVKAVRVDGPTSFGTLEPCVKEMVFGWAFPPSSDEYATEFSYVFVGNE